MNKNKYVLGIDIGGSHITAAVLDMQQRNILKNSYTRERVDSHGSTEQIIRTWRSAIKAAYQKVDIKIGRIGIAMPGPFDYDKGISYIAGNDKYAAFYGLNVKDMLASELQINRDQILMSNDAACFLAGEVFAGEAHAYQNLIGITLGTGLGSAVCKEGKITDANLWCSSFLNGIAEDYLSTRWFLKRYYELTGLNILNVRELTLLYEENQTVRKIFTEFGHNLGLFLKDFQQDYTAEAIIIGGNIANASGRFMPNVIKYLESQGIDTPIHISKLNEDAALVGAAGCWATQTKETVE
ncbi:MULTISPECIES: ROK family protein [unclassified Pedobacter]|uniref:ROK family protein n=1 Tax=unclassified Pedobacter TaxID=2628915 RepID=UPI0014212EBB|nr:MULTISPECIES: ROK family protein [unclassified Pedobacter]NII84008.1 glucokinase [Pedobacter sp. SG908]NMN37882.1 glucokinase [Pedobacter sp. SG918]